MTVQQTYAHDLIIRRLDDGDSTALRRLGELEGREAPRGRLLGAFLEDHLIAVVSAAGGESLADPFVPSAEAVELLRLRAEQMRGRRRARGRRLIDGLRGRQARGALAGSPPGGGGRLLRL